MGQQRIFIPSLGPSSWRAFLADPIIHWKRGKSAWELAVSWEAAAKTESGFPAEVALALESSSSFAGAELLVAIPEHRVVLDDQRRPSQSDLWLVIWTPNGYAAVMIEAKAGEEFDKPIGQWLKQESEGKERRLAFLTETLGLKMHPSESIRYQLVHRTAASILEAKRCRFPAALMLVQSFEESKSSWTDFEMFADLFGIAAARNNISGPKRIGEIDLFLGWVDSPKATDSTGVSAI